MTTHVKECDVGDEALQPECRHENISLGQGCVSQY